MRRRIRTAAVAVATCAGLGLAAAPAVAAPTDSTGVTLNVVGAGLDITAPDAAFLGSALPGTDISASIGTVRVVDQRGAADASWTASVTSTHLETGGGSPTERILASQIDYWSGEGAEQAGTGNFIPGQLAATDAEPLDTVTALTAFQHVGGTGVNQVAWSPRLIVHIPASAVVGTYTGTVTHSVA
ncbi:hypothetical protein GCM10027280_19730 [Micromonospora polyrhachis]|uniref:Uncharacterized protein n=1 Tax=Micromonospora polyrhachis TaxID=1282883 RepID=A0A7W7SLM2_9ACTN|nr:hypothetical protein [Micromonospora polyrhachis]MBB4957067.1 hypothetical protein [Micromonospora polyrhachis]